jgi:transcription initiation factor TFIIIB Brf1 subunit/transcription initiation factor TFIIB
MMKCLLYCGCGCLDYTIAPTYLYRKLILRIGILVQFIILMAHISEESLARAHNIALADDIASAAASECTGDSVNYDELMANLLRAKKGSSGDVPADYHVQVKCIECESLDIVEKEGYGVCRACGMRNECILDQGQEWRYYGGDDNTRTKDPARCGYATNELLPNCSNGVIMQSKRNESFEMKKIKAMQYWSSVSYREINLMKVFNSISITTQNAGIAACITEEAKIMYMKVSTVKSSRRIKKEAMKAASVTLACKMLNVPRNFEEICEMFNIANPKILRKALKTFEEIWFTIQTREQANQSYTPSADVQPAAPSADSPPGYNTNSYLHRLCNNIGIADTIYDQCKLVADHVDSNKILEKHSPLSRMAGVIFYIAQRDNIAQLTRKFISEKCKISEVTIAKCYNKIIKAYQPHPS